MKLWLTWNVKPPSGAKWWRVWKLVFAFKAERDPAWDAITEEPLTKGVE